MRRPLLLSVLAATALLTSCGQPKAAPKIMTVQTATIGEATFQPSIQAISLLESTTTVSLRPETDGRVVKVLAKDGQQVKAGQPILVLSLIQI